MRRCIEGGTKLAGKYKLEDAGTLYQLDIPDDVMPKLLDWDKPMSRQPKDVQASPRRLYDKLGWRWNDSQTRNVIYGR